MPVKVVTCQSPSCHFTKRYEAETWEHVCAQVANDFIFPLCRRCWGAYEQSVTETANALRRVDNPMREMMGRWV